VIGIKDCDLAEGDLGVFDPRFPGKNVNVVFVGRWNVAKPRAPVTTL